MKIWGRAIRHLIWGVWLPLCFSSLPSLGSEILVFSPVLHGATQFTTGWPHKCAYPNLARFPEVHGPFLFFFFFFWIYYFFLAVLEFCCSARASSRCGEWQLLFRCGTRVSHCGGVSCCRAQALGTPASVAVAHVLSCPAACGILVSGPGIKPMSPAWADEFLTTGALGKTLSLSFY